MAKVTKTLVGEALVGDTNEVAHIDLILGPSGSAAETMFCQTLTNQKEGHNGLLAIVAPNLMVKPPTVLFNKVTIKGEKQAAQMFGPAQRGVAMAVADCVEEGTLDASQAEDLFLNVGVFIHWEAQDDNKIQDWNYEATKQAIKSAVNGEPKAQDVLSKRSGMTHPFAAHA